MATRVEEIMQLPARQRVERLSRAGQLFHVVLAQQFSRNFIDDICMLAEMVRRIAGVRIGSDFLRNLLAHRRAMLYFTQPSTRTFLSFTSACQIVGARYNEVRDPKTSSEVKGESEEDAVRVFSQYFDVIIMRHPQEGFVEKTAHLINEMERTIPVINGGSGKDQHPTQALLDIYTLYQAFSGGALVSRAAGAEIDPFPGKKIAMVGDLKRGRTVRSLSYLLCRYPQVQIFFCSPPELAIGEDILEYLREHQVKYQVLSELDHILPDMDAVYMTRIQDEHDVAGESSKIDYSRFYITPDKLKRCKPALAIMHPLPRRLEIHVECDTDPRAKYWQQVQNGMWMRAALLAYVFNTSQRIKDYYLENYTY
ncbi:MAG: Aspartate carbamoyltransferase [Phycisphaerae bacterium]|nr:Aspartate carbamoyltransferase [Phycisphaerae bacterium]